MGSLILIAGVLMAAALSASLLAGRLRIPGLLLFLGIGMVTGSDGLGWVEFDDYELARDVGTNEQIAQLLVISPRTVERHRENILGKLGMRDRVELTRWAIRHGLVDP